MKMDLGIKFFLLTACFLICFLHLTPATAIKVSHDGRAITINGERKIVISGSIHYPRSTTEMWPDLIQKGKEGGLNAIETYVFWNIHEPSRRQYDFEGNHDLIRFLKTIQDAGLYAILRIGPYACAEWNYGGLPVWLHQMPGIQIRTDNEIYKNEMQNFTTLIVDMIKKENLLAPQGGPIILTQIENEYGNVMGPYGAAGKRYINWCAKLAESFNVDVPWIMCQQSDAPQPMIDTCNGFYCDNFKPNNPNSPKMWTENWTGWFKAWGGKDPHRPAEDVAFAVARFFQRGGTLQNYYMYHGGTNFGHTTGGPYITTSYDYDAPLDEYGNLRQPKWGHLKELHSVLMKMEKFLTYGDVTHKDFGHGAWATTYTLNATSVCFLSNPNTDADVTVTFFGNVYTIPAWSVSILLDCKNVAYNTGKVNTQTSIMVKKPNRGEDEPEKLTWSWRPEFIEDTLLGMGTFSANQLLEQNYVTGSLSDYLWYMTSVDIKKSDSMYSKNMILRVNTTGHGLYVFFNGKLVGSNYAKGGNYGFVLEVPVTVKPNKNKITLLSITVGLKNYGAFFDLAPTGIVGGPVQLIGNNNITKDLSSDTWTYKVGLNGEKKQNWADHDSRNWHEKSLLISKPMTWYKTTFKAPLGEDPVVVDLQGLGKGEAWVNGRSIGRYWPTFVAPTDCGLCDYHGPYASSKCANGCGQPTQRWYHVPRSWLKADDNSLILFEEMGGNPLEVNFQIDTVGSVCAKVEEGKTLELSCHGDRTISQIQFASYGDPQGTCESSFQIGVCEAKSALEFVKNACVGKASCSFQVIEHQFGSNNCVGCGIGTKSLAVKAIC